MLGSFESVQWNACVRKLDHGLYCHPKEFWGTGVRTHNNPTTGTQEKDRTHDAVSRRTASPTRY